MLALADIVMPLVEGSTIYRSDSDSGDLIAYLRYHKFVDDNTWVISDIYVSPFSDWRHKGFASSMLDELMALAHEEDATVVLHVAASEGGSLSNEQLMAWYYRHGFKDHASYSKFGPVMVSQ